MRMHALIPCALLGPTCPSGVGAVTVPWSYYKKSVGPFVIGVILSLLPDLLYGTWLISPCHPLRWHNMLCRCVPLPCRSCSLSAGAAALGFLPLLPKIHSSAWIMDAAGHLTHSLA